ncbi:Cyclic nucleotide-binding protein [Sphingobium herbicidovorans NBRC 16415]|uniref:Cyclic nucleotide-binding protein n=2 Tax=Sphingobium herbicidovorans TaxID=76947 RepID=A0A086P8U7_SPHHM|nr:Crp/Fnr family transcriptional regulator [Sphingopyxis sp. KK2]KFG89815.1 Cyclic nucleotide-binding protein [Sphingobium herbicidovorans NBRC 16415]
MPKSYHLATPERSELSAREFAELTAYAKVQHFADGQFVQHRGDPGDVFWAILDGHVTIGRHSEDGVFTHFAVLAAGAMFGELAFLTGMPRQDDAIAQGEASLIAIDRPLLHRLIAADVRWAELMMANLAQRLGGALNIIDAERRLNTTERLANMLVVMARNEAGRDVARATQQQLADLLGVSRMTLGASLAELAQQNQVRQHYGYIQLLGSLAERAANLDPP